MSLPDRRGTAARAHERAVRVTSATARTCADTRWGGRRVLLVEDDEPNREAIASFLTAEGYRVVPAVNGLDALHRLRGGADPSIILLDVQMPVMDGLQFRREQMRHPAIAHIPVVVCSAEEEPRDFRLVAQRWLRKPVDPTELLSTLGEYVAAPRHDSGAERIPRRVTTG